MGKDLNGKELGRGFSQRKDGRYEARAVICGTKIDIYDMNLAKLKKEFEVEKARVLRDEKNVRPNVTFREWYLEWFEKCKSPQLKSEVSRKTYDRKVRNTYCKILGDKRMENISQMNMQAATTELVEQGYTDRSVREALGIVNECMEIAIVNHIINVNPCVGIKIQNANERRERRVMKKWEQDLFLSEVKNRYYYEAYKILLLTGMRIGEFSGLQWRDIDFENKIIHVNGTLKYIAKAKVKYMIDEPKSESSKRDILMLDNLVTVLREHRKRQLATRMLLGDKWRPELGFENLVFTGGFGRCISETALYEDMKKIRTQIREDGHAFGAHTPHSLRHTFATRGFEKGIPPKVMQEILGHKSITMTLDIYSHVLPDKKAEEINKLAAMF